MSARSTDPPGEPARPAAELDDFDGEWVLLRDGAVVDHDPDPDALRSRAEPLRPGDAIVPIGHPPAGYQVIA